MSLIFVTNYEALSSVKWADLLTTWSTRISLVYMHLLCVRLDVLWQWCHRDVLKSALSLVFTLHHRVHILSKQIGK